MKVFKFGGASVKDASGVKNTAKVLEAVGCNDIIMVVSAMGKTTNAFEEGIKLYFENSDYQQKLNQILNFHLDIISELFESGHQVFTEVEDLLMN